MSVTSKSPKAVFRKAYEVGCESFADYSHSFSSRTFTQPQLFASLVLKAFFQTDYRGIEEILIDLPELCSEIGLKKVPHFTTLQKSERRLLNKDSTRKLLQETIRRALTQQQMKRIVELAAIDGSGFESRHVSHYFLKRQYLSGEDLWYRKHPTRNMAKDGKLKLFLVWQSDYWAQR